MYTAINHNLAAASTARTLNSHYGDLSRSVQRLSSGLRINSAADDAAGLAIRELQRADIAGLRQGARNANDAISMLQVADGALAIIDEKLIRMKELAEQAATGTYDSTQRLMIDSEFQAMAAEIERIATATDFNGIKLLDGSRKGPHDGSGLEATGALKIHFGTGNSSAEDYYYCDIPPATIAGLGLGGFVEVAPVPLPPPDPDWNVQKADVTQAVESIINDDINITSIKYTGSADSLGTYTNGAGAGLHPSIGSGLILSTGNVASTMNPPGSQASASMGDTKDNLLAEAGAVLDPVNIKPSTIHDAAFIDIEFTANTDRIYFNFVFASEEYPVYTGTSVNDFCAIILDGNPVDGNCSLLENIISIDGAEPPEGLTGIISQNAIFSDAALFNDNQGGDNSFVANGFSKTFRIGIDVAPGQPHSLHISIADVGDSILDSMVLINGFSTSSASPVLPAVEGGITGGGNAFRPIDIQTQAKAQYALTRIDKAIVAKDKIRAHLGALQNRLENTVTNLNIQAENLQAAESRISDVDVGTEMTNFVRNQILTQSATAMLSQANGMPQMLSSLVQG